MIEKLKDRKNIDGFSIFWFFDLLVSIMIGEQNDNYACYMYMYRSLMHTILTWRVL